MTAHGRMELVFARGPLLVFATSAGHELKPDGIVIGTYFSLSSVPFEFTEFVERETLLSGGSFLVDKLWGGYVVCIVSPDRETVRILRSPLGDLPCYWQRSNELTLVGSDLTALITAGTVRPLLDPSQLARHLAAEDLSHSQTCLYDIRDLHGGDRLSVGSQNIDCETLWSPWSFVTSDNEIADRQAAEDTLREAIVHSVNCVASQFGSIILKLSGGLDSSILAACLAQGNARFTCLNLVTEHPAGDERHYGRLVASHLDAPLVERFRDIQDVDLRHSAAARLPRPSARSFTQASACVAQELAQETMSQAVFDGGGGDNVFCSLQSARPLADCLLRSDGRRYYWPTARSIADLAEVNLWAVVRRSLAISTRRSASYRLELDTRFMSAEAAQQARSGTPHPWLVAPPRVLPGKAAHVALIAAAQSVVEGADAEAELPAYSPLISQPVVEACLRIPTWLWFGHGLNRFAARRAFAESLPAAVMERRSKGAPDCFVADLYEANRDAIRDLLLGGVLNAQRLLDCNSIETAIADQTPIQGHDFLRIMHLVDVEAWARVWS